MELSLVLRNIPLAATEGLTTTPTKQAAADKSKDCDVLRPKLMLETGVPPKIAVWGFLDR